VSGSVDEQEHSIGELLKYLWSPMAATLTLALVSLAQAEEPDAQTRTIARDLASQGVEAFEQQDYPVALDRLTRAYDLVPAPTISVLRARALAKLDRVLEALDEYARTRNTPLSDSTPAAFKKAVEDARQEGDLLWTRVPRLTIHVRAPNTTPKDTRVLLDSKRLPPAMLEVAQPVDPGSHEVKVDADGYAPETRNLAIDYGQSVILDIALNPTRRGKDLASTPPTRELGATIAVDARSADRSHANRFQPWAWTAVGVGAAGLAVSGISGVMALEKKSSLDAQCQAGCPQNLAGDITAFRTARTLSYTTFFVGSALVGVGGYILLTHSGGSHSVGAAVGPGHASLWGAF
jgi:hypothetical protein